ncbi:hypothetical protein G5I_04905 [Acromyrmex echinatior]|uniref:Uncharacterized protein n=1 Tax=Acromyrmex echinatior TaxID=103372 RepID=F4WGV4_ACREC|nr:hypothetical protein G5I_04905 [Acromyrmex echinatior]
MEKERFGKGQHGEPVCKRSVSSLDSDILERYRVECDGGGGSAEIIFHVGRCEINNGQTRFDFPEVPVGSATHCVRLGKARERDLLAAAESAASRRRREGVVG